MAELHTRFEEAWREFLESVKKILGPLPDDRGLDQFMEFRDMVLEMVENDLFQKELNHSYRRFIDNSNDKKPSEAYLDVGEALVLELKGFSKGLEVELAVKQNDKSNKKEKWWQRMRKWFGRASTVTNSVKDLLDDFLPSWAKGTLTVFRELLDIFKA